MVPTTSSSVAGRLPNETPEKNVAIDWNSEVIRYLDGLQMSHISSHSCATLRLLLGGHIISEGIVGNLSILAGDSKKNRRCDDLTTEVHG